MGGVFSKPKTPDIPTPDVSPAPIPDVGAEAADEAKRSARKRRGRSNTFITGELVPQEKNLSQKTLLGG